MGLKADKTDRMLNKHRGTILKGMYELNRFSKYLGDPNQSEDIGEQIQLQAVCISELGRIMEEEVGLKREKVVNGLELAFEKKRNKWRGQNAAYFLGRVNDSRVTSYNLATILKRISNAEFGIEKRIIKNHWHYMSNGYKEMIRKGVLW